MNKERYSDYNPKTETEMNKPNLLFVEDEDSDLAAFMESVRVYKEVHGREVNIVSRKTVSEALATLDGSFDGAIIDLTLNGQEDGGDQVINKIIESLYRVPIAIFTGTPIDRDENHIEVFIKGDNEHDEILEWFCGYYDTGLTRIMGGRGKFDEVLYRVFTQSLVPQIERWIAYGKADQIRTESALLRHTLNHLSHLLEDDSEYCVPEEFYLSPPLTDDIRTGMVVYQKEVGSRFVVMSPACDLVEDQNGRPKTDRILVVGIDTEDLIPLNNKNHAKRNRIGYYHWLPSTGFFEGGFLNFRKLSTIAPGDFGESFEPASIQIAPSFLKDIVSRFSSYYARQGQPGIEDG